MATLIGPVPLTPNDREVARNHYAGARANLRRARSYFHNATEFDKLDLPGMVAEWRDLALDALTLALFDRHCARVTLRRASGLSGDWGSPWA